MPTWSDDAGRITHDDYCRQLNSGCYCCCCCRRRRRRQRQQRVIIHNHNDIVVAAAARRGRRPPPTAARCSQSLTGEAEDPSLPACRRRRRRIPGVDLPAPRAGPSSRAAIRFHHHQPARRLNHRAGPGPQTQERGRPHRSKRRLAAGRSAAAAASWASPGSAPGRRNQVEARRRRRHARPVTAQSYLNFGVFGRGARQPGCCRWSSGRAGLNSGKAQHGKNACPRQERFRTGSDGRVSGCAGEYLPVLSTVRLGRNPGRL